VRPFRSRIVGSIKPARSNSLAQRCGRCGTERSSEFGSDVLQTIRRHVMKNHDDA